MVPEPGPEFERHSSMPGGRFRRTRRRANRPVSRWRRAARPSGAAASVARPHGPGRGRRGGHRTGCVPEHPQVAQLVGGDGVERLGRREDQAPAERQVPRPRAAAPAAGRVADRDPGRLHAQRGSVALDRLVDGGAGAGAEPGLEDRRRAAGRAPPAPPAARRPASPPTRDDADVRAPAGAATTRTRCGCPRYGTVRPSSSEGRASRRARDATCVSRWRRIQPSRSARKAFTSGSGRAQPAPRGGRGSRRRRLGPGGS